MSSTLKTLAVAAALCLSAQAQAATVTFTRTLLPGDNVQHHYLVQGGMADGDSLGIVFEPDLYSRIIDAGAPVLFDLDVVQPSAANGTNGFVFLVALEDISADFSFSTMFSRVGDLPPTQNTSYRGFDDEIGIPGIARLTSVIEPPDGGTVAEPTAAALALGALGLLGLGRIRRTPARAAVAA